MDVDHFSFGLRGLALTTLKVKGGIQEPFTGLL